jgi:hypothetical protein
MPPFKLDPGFSPSTLCKRTLAEWFEVGAHRPRYADSEYMLRIAGSFEFKSTLAQSGRSISRMSISSKSADLPHRSLNLIPVFTELSRALV